MGGAVEAVDCAREFANAVQRLERLLGAVGVAGALPAIQVAGPQRFTDAGIRTFAGLAP